MKQTMLLSCLLLAGICASAQKVRNYNSNGKYTESKTDFMTITLEHHDKAPVAGNVASVGGIITAIAGPVLKIIVDAWTAHIENKQKSFTATYSNQAVVALTTANYLDMQKPGNIYLHLRRYAVNSLSDKLEKAALCSEYIFEVSQFTEDRAELRLISVYLGKSKARYNDPEEDLAIGIDIKLTPTVADASPAEDAAPADDKDKDKKGEGAGKKSTDGGAKKEGKTADADAMGGESIVKIPLIKVADAPTTIDKDVVLVNHAIFKGIPKPGVKPLNMTIAVTITEANVDHLEPSLVEKLIQSNGSDLIDAVKAVISGGSSSKSKGDQ